LSASLRGITKTYRAARPKREVIALDDVDIEVEAGELLVVVGPSGSGKTTLLRCVAGLERPDTGRVEVEGRDVTNVPPGERDLAMVFQDFALYPHLSVKDNISFGLRARKVSPEESQSRVERAADMLGLADVLDARPSELSGGERQRVALARAIVREPCLFLLDEPLSNLDAELRTSTRSEIRALQRSLGTTMIHVTHDQVEALTMGDRVAVLRAGRLEQISTPMDLYDKPQTAFVARFIGNPPMNLLPAHVSPDGARGPVIGIRPEHVLLTDPERAGVQGYVRAVEHIGDAVIVHVDLGEHVVIAKVYEGRFLPEEGSRVGVNFGSEDSYAFDGFDGRVVE
jgi:ABC-type sugar transport system ATPase subunit